MQKMIMTELDSPKQYLQIILPAVISTVLVKMNFHTIYMLLILYINFWFPFNTFSVVANKNLALFLSGEWSSPLRRAAWVGGRAWLGGGVGVELWTVWPAPVCGGVPWGRVSTKFTDCPPFTTIWPANTPSFLVNTDITPITLLHSVGVVHMNKTPQFALDNPLSYITQIHL
jgi:hypothetical protein